MQRNKTQRRRPTQPPSQGQGGPGQGPGGIDSIFHKDTIVSTTEKSLDALFSTELTQTFQQPWQKLDKGSRLNRLRKFTQSFVSTLTPSNPLTAAERASLLTAILQAFELRQLNTKGSVEYDPTTATILSIRGLREIASSSGLRTFRIDPVPIARTTTQKARVAKPPQAPQAPQAQTQAVVPINLTS